MEIKNDLSLSFYSVIINKRIIKTCSINRVDLNTFFIDKMGNPIRVEASFFGKRQIVMARAINLGDIVQFFSSGLSIHMETDPPFLALFEPKIQKISIERTEEEWRVRTNKIIREGHFTGEIFTKDELYEEILKEPFDNNRILLPEQ